MCGLLLLVINAGWIIGVQKNKVKLRLFWVQTGSGALIMALILWYLIKIEPRWISLSRQVIEANGGDGTVFYDSNWLKLVLGWKIINMMTGLFILALGIRQLLSFKKPKFTVVHPTYSQTL